jgi:hypothetical protein
MVLIRWKVLFTMQKKSFIIKMTISNSLMQPRRYEQQHIHNKVVIEIFYQII